MHNPRYQYVCILLLLGFCGLSRPGELKGQRILNPSFEGEGHETAPRDNTLPVTRWPKLPADWRLALREFYPNNTPDFTYMQSSLQAPEHGEGYVNLTYRTDGTREAIEQILETPLKGGTIYRSRVHLSKVMHIRGYPAGPFFNGPAVLRIWGGDFDTYHRELLWTSPVIENESWESFLFELAPAEEVEILILEVYKAPDEEDGYICVDLFGPISEGAYWEFSLGPDSTLCAGDTLLLDGYVPLAVERYLWTRLEDGKLFRSFDPAFTITTPGTYAYETRFDNNPIRDTIKVRFLAPPKPDLGVDQTLCLGESVILRTGLPDSFRFSWQDGGEEATYHVLDQPGRYRVSVEDAAGCVGTDDVWIGYQDCELILEMPNVFTPNGDGTNDIFVPMRHKGLTSGTLTIYDRLGRKLFTGPALDSGWNGRMRSMPASPGVYFWHIHGLNVLGESVQRKGSLSLIR